MINYNPKIKKLTVENFRIFDNISIDFSEHGYYALVGKNGKGKTTILEAINICLSDNSSKYNSIKNDDFKTDKPIIITIDFDDLFFLSVDVSGFNRLFPCKKLTKTIKQRERSSGDFFSSPFVIDVQYELQNYERLKPNEFDRKFSKYESYLNKKNQFIVWEAIKKTASIDYSIKTNDRKLNIPLNVFLTAPKTLFPKVFYFDKNRERELLLKYNTTLSSIVSELNWKYKHSMCKEDKEDERIKFKNHYSELHKDLPEVKKLKDKLLKPAIKILKDSFGIEYDIEKLDFYFFDNDEPFLNSVFGHLSDCDKIIKISKTGSGISALCALSLLISYAKETNSPIILLIDEPELHLHSDLQKKLFEFLNNKTFNTIVSTHSHLFLDKKSFLNNLRFSNDSQNNIDIDPCNQISLASTIFDFLGNSLEDLYIPENLVLVEGKYDKIILERTLTLSNNPKKSILINICGSCTEITTNVDLIEEYFDKHFNQDNWYSKYISDKFRIIIDGDVPKTKVDAWVSKYGLAPSQINHITKKSLEYLFPINLIKQLVKDKKLKDGTDFSGLTKDEIIEIILSDENKTQENRKQSTTDRISKQRLTEFVSKNLNKVNFKSDDCKELLEITDWLIGNA